MKDVGSINSHELLEKLEKEISSVNKYIWLGMTSIGIFIGLVLTISVEKMYWNKIQMLFS